MGLVKVTIAECDEMGLVKVTIAECDECHKEKKEWEHPCLPDGWGWVTLHIPTVKSGECAKKVWLLCGNCVSVKFNG